MPAAEKKLGKEPLITIIQLLKSFYDEEVFLHFTKEFYNSDLDVSLTAIESSAVIANEYAVPHLYKMIEKGKPEQKIAGIKALAVIRAPSSIPALIKYFSLFPDKAVRIEIMRTLTAIALDNEKFIELLKNTVTDTHAEEDLRVAASDGLVAARRLDLIKPLVKSGPPKVRKNLIKQCCSLSAEKAGEIFLYAPELAKTLDVESLGYFLAGYLLFNKQADQKTVIAALTGKTKDATLSFLRALLDCEEEIAQPLRVFKMLLIVPYLNRETEKLTGENLEKIVAVMREKAPYAVNELVTITVAHLEALSGKIKKNFLSLGAVAQKEALLGGEAQKEALLSLLFARLIENYASPLLLEDIQRYFKGFKTQGEKELVESIRRAMVEASEEEKNQFKACLPLFNPARKAEQMRTATMLTNVDLGRPFLIRRLNRFVRLAGLLGIKTVIKNVQKILEFARTERIGYLEETAVVSLCQLYDKPTVDRAAGHFARPLENLPSLKGYVRGLRFVSPPLYLKELAEILLKPEVGDDVKLCALDTLDRFDLRAARGVLPALIKAFFIPSGEPRLKPAIERLIIKNGDALIFQAMLGFLDRPELAARLLAVRTLREIVLRDKNLPREVLVNRYYLLLEDPNTEVKQEALVALLALKDDYAIEVFGDYFKKENRAELPALLERLKRPLTREVAQFLFGQVGTNEPVLQRTLRGLLQDAAKSDFAEELRNVLLDYLNRQQGKVIKFSSPVAAADEGAGLVGEAKEEFKFKRENAQILTVFFCDMAGYTEKASQVNATTIITVIRSFEGIVFPTIEEFRGQVIKTFGDGILAAFKHPLNAVLAALTVQKKVRDYNLYKTDDEKFYLRIGLNTGQVIRKQNDIFGDVVNVASRMQAAANPGDIRLTLDTYNEIQNYVKCTPLGKIDVKGKGAIAAYTAQEVKVDFNHLLKAGAPKAEAAKPGAVDPITNLKESMFTPRFAAPAGVAGGRALLRELEKLFGSVAAAVEELAKDYHEEYELKRYLQRRWDLLVKNWDRLLAEPEESGSRAVSS
jgi:class 3 adenylate cyclase/HEAT repeat protein